MTGQPYPSSSAHLADELALVDELVKARTRHWWTTLGSRTTETWQLGEVDDAEIESYLGSRFRLGDRGEEAGPVVPDRSTVADRVAASRRAGTALRLELLASRFGLDDAERDLLLLALLPELDRRYHRLYWYLLDDDHWTGATVGLLDELLSVRWGPYTARAMLEPGARLVVDELVLVSGWSAAEGPARRVVRVDDRIVAFLLCSDAVDPRVAACLRLLTPEECEPDDLPDDRAPLLARLSREPGGRIVFTGGDPRSHLATAAAIGDHEQSPVLVAEAGAAAGEDGPAVVRLVRREARLRAAVLFWQHCETLFERGRPLPIWDAVVAGNGGLTLFDHAAPWDPEGRAGSSRMVRWAMPRTGVPERGARWHRVLLELPESRIDDVAATAQRLAQTFELSASRIDDAAAVARDLALADSPRTATVTVDHLLEACRRQSGRRLLTLTERVAVPSGLDLDEQIVLPAEQRRQLHDLVDRIRLRKVLAERHPDDAWRRPSGVVCMFVGSSGTGKTHTAACVASALGKDLLKVDLPAVVSKWVGETEKNLQQVFAEAEDANAVMFFDEAESFFARRGEVKGAQDRWAMMETAYLLQRIERYDGAVILATNLRQQIDEAFLRRIQVVVEFPLPDPEQRAELWTRALLRRRPDLDRDGVGREFRVAEIAERYSLTGAAIESVVDDMELQTAAAQSISPGGWLTLLDRSLRREMAKQGRPSVLGDR